MSGRLNNQAGDGGGAVLKSAPWGKARQEQPANVTVTNYCELCHSGSAGAETASHLLDHGGGLLLLGMTGERRE